METTVSLKTVPVAVLALFLGASWALAGPPTQEQLKQSIAFFVLVEKEALPRRGKELIRR